MVLFLPKDSLIQTAIITSFVIKKTNIQNYGKIAKCDILWLRVDNQRQGDSKLVTKIILYLLYPVYSGTSTSKKTDTEKHIDIR